MFVCAKRAATMRGRLGKASELIKNNNFLPFFRNRQINHPAEFSKSVEIAQQKRNPEHYLAFIWAKRNLMKTVRMIRGLINRAKMAAADKAHYYKELLKQRQLAKQMNPEGRARLLKLYGDSGLFGIRR